MDLKKLQELGGVAPSSLVKKDVVFKYHPLLPEEEWSDPGVPERSDEIAEQTLTVHLKPANAQVYVEYWAASEEDKPFVYLYRCIRNEDGGQLFNSLDDLRGLEPWMILKLNEVLKEFHPTTRKKSQPGTSSGASSPSDSAED